MGSISQQQQKQQLPVIDLRGENQKAGTDSWSSTRRDVVRALEEFGCFVATYDKISADLHDSIFQASKQLFDLPTETKVLNTYDTPGHGYVGQVPVIPLYEGLGIENSTTLQGAQAFTQLMWPSGNYFFRDTCLLLSRLLAELDQTVMRMVSESYGIEKDYDTLLGSTSYLLRLIKYRRPEANEANLGIVPHTDKSFMSILHQHQVKGLEIKTKDGHWITVDPSPSSFIVMAGDVCTAWTNGRIEAPNHRVTMESGSEERYSLGLFTFIRDAMIEVPKELVDEQHSLQFKPLDHFKFIHFYYTDEGKKSKCPIRAYCGL